MQDQQIIADIHQFLNTHQAFAGLVPENLTPDDSLLQADIIDSMGIFHLIVYMEERFGIHIEVQDISEQNFQSLRAMGNLVQRKMDASIHAST